MRALFTALALVLSGTASAASLKCGSELVAEGATRLEVQNKCGEPTWKESHVEYDTLRLRDPYTGASYSRAVERVIEEWTYNRGPYAFIQTVIFENGKLKDVVSGNYGK
ncbi:MAG: DUF2845 domain-containing protein [Myxococcaceae bacterium]